MNIWLNSNFNFLTSILYVVYSTIILLKEVKRFQFSYEVLVPIYSEWLRIGYDIHSPITQYWMNNSLLLVWLISLKLALPDVFLFLRTPNFVEITILLQMNMKAMHPILLLRKSPSLVRLIVFTKAQQVVKMDKLTDINGFIAFVHEWLNCFGKDTTEDNLHYKMISKHIGFKGHINMCSSNIKLCKAKLLHTYC